MTESKNYFDKNGNYINVENLSLAEIYHRAFASGVESVAVRPQGKWLKCQNDMFRCSNCRQAVEVPIAMGNPIYNFCPNCGADMRGGAK